MLHEFYQPNTLILDIGANIGNHTLYFSKVIGSQVISFEPEPHNCVCLAANVIINDLADSVKLVNFALGSMCGTIQLKMIVNSNYGSFTNIPVKNPHHIPVRDEKSVNVPLKNLDSLFFDKQISIIKLDVEGMEIDVLRGGRQIIEKCLPVLAVECISIDLLKKTEKELISFGYFPMDMFNATPTFIFLSRKNQSHFDCLSRFLRLRSISKAKRVKRKVRDKFSSQQLFSKK
jgi:FkbM family methyltransferase